QILTCRLWPAGQLCSSWPVASVATNAWCTLCSHIESSHLSTSGFAFAPLTLFSYHAPANMLRLSDNNKSTPKKVDPRKGVFYCGYCKKRFSHQRSRERHERMHTGRIQFFCDICYVSFTRND